MSKKVSYLLGIAITIILGTFLYLKFCCNCCDKTTTDDAPKIVSPAVQEPNFVPFVLNGSGIEYQTHDNLKFLKNSAILVMPVSDSVTTGIEKLKAFLSSNPKQKVTITGYATSDEKNTTTFENLGLARANDVKNYFVSKGMSENQFNTKGEIIDKWKMNADTLLGPANYSFEAIDSTATTDEWSALRDKINADPLILHFNTNQSRLTLSDAEKEKITAITQYLEHVKVAVVLAVGHSDNVGNRDSNIILGQKRADFSKNYLSKNGIDAARIETQSKGPDDPIGDNNTSEGKAENRRTVITIK
ncbi:outer membrane protein OmpA-like peptidoglycan-associated protein [Flavobacterium nitrogenifigens]|uniref:Outer membrane protein OmpA-like peptidoglycan-associated protein n=2 Tax=Flavobacterium TaxID=237 RepID=A0A7W7NA03_9FLAO|nr:MULTISPECIES: OmpA family protein [Flavobacterium]MBB4804019.1 outer membrane protein OmpA-like peptidoglycan-associated protein [Flavobacterium nitrogenifigens]MBB6388829.1 outer membrane protein OmpA-like peptidoglycan-associated protein [Flavobacterium notoginsengisoli]